MAGEVAVRTESEQLRGGRSHDGNDHTQCKSECVPPVTREPREHRPKAAGTSQTSALRAPFARLAPDGDQCGQEVVQVPDGDRLEPLSQSFRGILLGHSEPAGRARPNRPGRSGRCSGCRGRDAYAVPLVGFVAGFMSRPQSRLCRVLGGLAPAERNGSRALSCLASPGHPSLPSP